MRQVIEFTLNVHCHFSPHDPLVVAISDLRSTILAAIDDFNQAVQDFSAELATDLQALSDAVTAEIARVAAALSTSSDPAIVAATATLQQATADLQSGAQAIVERLNQELPAPPPGP